MLWIYGYFVGLRLISHNKELHVGERRKAVLKIVDDLEKLVKDNVLSLICGTVIWRQKIDGTVIWRQNKSNKPPQKLITEFKKNNCQNPRRYIL